MRNVLVFVTVIFVAGTMYFTSQKRAISVSADEITKTKSATSPIPYCFRYFSKPKRIWSGGRVKIYLECARIQDTLLQKQWSSVRFVQAYFEMRGNNNDTFLCSKIPYEYISYPIRDTSVKTKSVIVWNKIMARVIKPKPGGGDTTIIFRQSDLQSFRPGEERRVRICSLLDSATVFLSL